MLHDPILVTGGAGFIGSALTKKLLSQGHSVIVVDNLSFGRLELLQPMHDQCTFIQEDIRDAAALRKIVQRFKPRGVFHLAALHFIPYCNSHPVEAVEVNVNGTRNLLTALGEAKPNFVLFASTAAVYPLEGSPFSECGPVGPVDIYGHTKLAGEDLIRLFFLESGVPSIVCRFFNVFGPDDTNPHLIPEIVSQLQKDKTTVRLGNMEPVRDYIHVYDMRDAILALSNREHESYGLFNIGSGNGYSVSDVIVAFEQTLGHPIKIVQEADRIRKVERLSLVSNIAKIQKEIGWTPALTLSDGIIQLAKNELCR